MKLEVSEVIDRPAATVFDFVGFEHVANHPRWDLMLQLEQVTDGPIGVGTVVRRRHTHFGEPLDGVMECVEFDPPRAIGFAIHDGPVEINGRICVEPEGPDRSVLTITADMPGMDGPLDPRLVEESARRIRQLVESER
jgi:Polyketide cyclase / dehydrase and lipid transport